MMQNNNFFSKILLGLKRSPRRFLLFFASSYSGLWIIVEPIIGLAVNIEHNYIYYIVFMFLSASLALIYIYPEKSIKIKLGGTNTEVEILFGDIFKVEGFKSIPVSQYFFEGNIGELISNKSLQSQLIQIYFKDEISIYKNRLKLSLDEIETEINIDKNDESIKYPLGTTIHIKKDSQDFLIFALTQTENMGKLKFIKTENATLVILVDVLLKFWEKVKKIAPSQIINIPLIGSGVSGIGLPSMAILELNLLIIIEACKKGFISHNIRIVLHEKIFDEIDLNLIKEFRR